MASEDRLQRQVLDQMITGCWVTQAIYVAAELGIADILDDGAQTAAEIARQVEVNSEGLHRVLRVLTTLGVFRENVRGQFEQTALSERLRSDVPLSVRGWARMNGSPWMWEMLGGLLSTVRTGKKSWRGWEYFEDHEQDGHVFNQAMASLSAPEIQSILGSYDFSGIRRLMDVAGGYGSLLTAVLKANPDMQGILFDIPPVIEAAKKEVDASGIADRCELAGGDFFDSVPGADAIMMKHVIHDWDDEHAVRILKTCHSALPQGGKLLVIDNVIVPGSEESAAQLLDIALLLVGGRKRSEVEFRALFAAAGFELARIVPTASPVSVIEGRRN